MTILGKSDNKRKGDLGEDMAAENLEKNGYELLCRNYRKRYGEIDIIARKENRLYFVEVKTRRGESYGSPLESITPRKQKKIYQVAQEYLAEHPDLIELDIGFLGVGIYLGVKGEYFIETVEDYIWA